MVNKMHLRLVSILLGLMSLQVTSKQIQIGLLIDHNDDVTAGVSNVTIHEMMADIFQDPLNNFDVQHKVIDDFDQFHHDVDDEPGKCESLTAIISAVSCETTKKLYQLVQDHCPNTLLLSVHGSRCDRPSPSVGVGLKIRNGLDDIIPMIHDMQYDYLSDWKEITLIHDDFMDLKTTHDFVEQITTKSTIHLEGKDVITYRINSLTKDMAISDHTRCIKQMGETGSYSPHHLMHHLTERNDGHTHFMAIGSSETLELVIEEAHMKGLLSNPNQWIFIFMDNRRGKKYWNNVGPMLALGRSVIIKREMDAYTKCGEYSEGCQVKMAFDLMKRSMKKMSENITDYEENELLNNRKLMKNRLLVHINGLIANEVNHCGSCDRFVMRTPEMKDKPGPNPKPWIKRPEVPNSVWIKDQDYAVQLTKKGDWTPFKGFQSEGAASDLTKRRLIKVLSFHQPPRMRVDVGDPKAPLVAVGAMVEVLKMVQERMNFSIEWLVEQDPGILNPETPGQNSKALLRLKNREVDLIANPFYKLPKMKAHKFKWSNPVSEESLYLMVQKSSEDHDWMFLMPFTKDMWISLIASVGMIAPFIHYINGRCKYYDYHGIRRDKGLFNLSNCYWYSYGALVGQGGDYLPPAVTARMIVASWWLFVIVIATTYSGNLVACLTFPKIFQYLQNADDLINTWNMRWYTQVNSQDEEIALNEMNQPIALLKKHMRYVDMKDIKVMNQVYYEVGIDKSAFIANKEEIRWRVSDDYIPPIKYGETRDTGLNRRKQKCRLHLAKEAVYRAPVYIMFKQNMEDEFIKQFNVELETLGVSGYIAHWFQQYEQIGNDCLKPNLIYAGDVRKIEVHHMHGSYCILAVGLLISVVCFALEILFWNYIRPHLPARYQQSNNNNMLDNYNKIFMGYGYSNVRPTSSTGTKKEAKTNVPAPPPKLAIGTIKVPEGGYNTKLNKTKLNSITEGGNVMPTAPTLGMYEAKQTATNYNTRANYNYYNYGQSKTEFRNKFGVQ